MVRTAVEALGAPPERPRTAEEKCAALDALLDMGTEQEHRESFEALARGLDEDRPVGRTLFPPVAQCFRCGRTTPVDVDLGTKCTRDGCDGTYIAV